MCGCGGCSKPQWAILGNDDNDDGRAREYDDVRVYHWSKIGLLISPLPSKWFYYCLDYYYDSCDYNIYSGWRIPVLAIGRPAR